MSKRPLCAFALLFMAVIWCLNLAGVPFFGNAPPVLPNGCSPGHAVLEGRVYETKSNSFYTTLYIRQVKILSDPNKYSIEQVKVNIKNDLADNTVRPGGKVRLTGDLQQIPLPFNPGQFNERSYYYARKIKWYLEGSSMKAFPPDAWSFEALRCQVKSFLSDKILELAPFDTGGIFCAMLLGEKQEIGKEDQLLLKLDGVLHIAAISGTHLSFLGWGLFRLLRKLRVPVAAAGGISVILMVQYGIFTGSSASAMRAVIMFSLAVGAMAAGRTYDLLSALSLSAVLLLLESPGYLYDSGFLLSFGAILGLAVVYPAFSEKKEKRKTAMALKSGLAVQLATIPIQMYFFYELPVFGILVNLLVLPTVGIVLASGGFGCLAGLAVPFLGELFMLPGAFFLKMYLFMGQILRQIPFASVITGRPAMWKILLYYILLAVWAAWGRKEEKKRHILLRYLPLILGVFLLFLRIPDKKLRITFLDVGQGDCSVVMYEGKTYVVDGGSSSVSGVGNYRILPFLKYMGIRKVDAIFLSHMDDDHINGIGELLEAIRNRETTLRIEKIFLSECNDKQEKRKAIEKTGHEAGCRILYLYGGDRIKSGELELRCLYPYENTEGDGNEASQALLLSLGDFRALFTGDMEGAGETAVTEALEQKQIEAQVLKVAHHGSKNSTSLRFLEALKPAAGIISCGEDNRYGHPHRELTERLLQEKVKIFQTKELGAVFLVTDGKRSEVSFQHKKSMVN